MSSQPRTCPFEKKKCLSLYVLNRQLRSSKDYHQLHYPKTKVFAGDKTSTVTASRELNKLPIYIRQSSSTSASRRHQKLICSHIRMFITGVFSNIFMM